MLALAEQFAVVGDGARVRLPAGATAVEVGATLGVRFNRPAARLTAAGFTELAETDAAAAEARVREMCEKLLANTVIENYAVELA